ncbi:MAG: hypothetical protein ABIQ24_02935 [Nitrospiraceae bacterium]
MSVAATPTTYQVKLKLRHEVALETMAFHFEKPAGFRLTAGQFIDMTLTNPHETDAEGNVRSFSHAQHRLQEGAGNHVPRLRSDNRKPFR